MPLLGVLPGTGGLTRVVDKRHVRKDRADLFATKSEGYRGEHRREWGLVDATVPRKRFERGRAPSAPRRGRRRSSRPRRPRASSSTPLDAHRGRRHDHATRT